VPLYLRRRTENLETGFLKAYDGFCGIASEAILCERLHTYFCRSLTRRLKGHYDFILFMLTIIKKSFPGGAIVFRKNRIGECMSNQVAAE
jgi:hypothetical protein